VRLWEMATGSVRIAARRRGVARPAVSRRLPASVFCHACGAAVTEVAAASSAASAVPAGDAVSGRGREPVAERRVCSVLFCDVVGFTPLAEGRDPEAVRELLSEYFGVARTVVGRYGGVVEKFIGDAVMAVWGTPVAAEGEAERAVRAALDLVAAVAALGAETGAPDLAARAGVATCPCTCWCSPGPSSARAGRDSASAGTAAR